MLESLKKLVVLVVVPQGFAEKYAIVATSSVVVSQAGAAILVKAPSVSAAYNGCPFELRFVRCGAGNRRSSPG